MNPSLLKKAQTPIQYWWVHLLGGLLFIVGSIWIITTPLASFIGLGMLFSVMMFVSGLFEIILH